MNIKTNLIEEYVNFVDNTKKQKKTMYSNMIIILQSCLHTNVRIIITLFVFEYM